MKDQIILGIDVGGTGIKGALVDVKKGKMITERFRLDTPQPSTPEKISDTFNEIVKHFEWKGKIGVGFPAVIKNGVSFTASNIHKDWIGTDVATLFSKVSNCPVIVLNDADAAGLAEITFGVGKKQKGTIVLITVGTGLGTAVFLDRKLLTNTELGHIYLKGHNEVAEKYASNTPRMERELDWEDWGGRFKVYLNHLQFILNPDLFIIGGGMAKNFDKFGDIIKIDTPIKPAKLLNEAGIIGAAARAGKLLKTTN